MLRKITVIAASTVLLAFGGAFANTVDAQSVEKQPTYKVYYSINGQVVNLDQEDASNLVKKAFQRIQSKFLTNFDWKELAANSKKEVETKEPAKKAEQPKEEVKQPAPKKEEPKQEVKQPEPKKEQPVEKKEAPEAPAKEEAPKAEAPAPQQPAQPAQPVEQPQQQTSLSQFEVQVVELTNQERAKNGLAPLQIDEEVSRVAREKSRDMAANGYFDHNSPVYGSPFDMMKSFGINYNSAGENIAKGQRTPQEVVNAWMNSPGHRANILNGSFTHIGVGFVEQGNHWTQMFIGK